VRKALTSMKARLRGTMNPLGLNSIKVPYRIWDSFTRDDVMAHISSKPQVAKEFSWIPISMKSSRRHYPNFILRIM